ncbi:pentatricopeptide repeat-containing protein At5g03800 [Euphorbia lathyris]|uniref:pentatricopeptide repeat-containing protein At5g03800 n=1 Tax=Euphorbia lathyris TaxID=212925 RepID=UPI00331401A1
MAAIIPQPVSTISPISPFFHSSSPFPFPLKSTKTPTFSLAHPSSTFKPNPRHELHSHPPFSASASANQSILSPDSNSTKPLFHLHSLDNSTSSSDTTTDSIIDIDHLLNLLRLSHKYTDFELARAVHASILKFSEDTYLGNAVIVAYLKLGVLRDAYKVFKGLNCPNVVSYTVLISSFAKVSREREAIELFFEMRSLGIEPNEYSFVAILTACIRILDFELGLQIHALTIKTGVLESVFVANVLMGLYGKSGCLDYAIQVFDEMPQRDITTWNTVLSSLVNEKSYGKALDIFRDLCCSTGLKADHFTLSTVLTACAGFSAVLGGREAHGHAIRIGLGSNLSLNNAILGFYTKCRNLKDAEALFEIMPVRDVISWTQMIVAFMEFGLVDSAMKLFEKMPEKNSISYNVVLGGFCSNGEGLKALQFFLKMVHEEVELTDFTLTSIVNACGILMNFKISRQIHGFIVKFGFGSNVCIETALLEMYTRCGRMGDANRMFRRWPSDQDSSIIITSMLCGYARNGMPEKAIYLFYKSQSEGAIIVDEVVLSSVLGICGTLGFHDMGEQIHGYALKTGYISEIRVGNAVISMYSKCGNMDSAIKSFDSIQTHDIVSWNCLITGHLLHRQGDEALAVWSRMNNAGLKPDAITSISIISAYKHTSSNLVHECHSFFLSMKKSYGLDPTAEHYTALMRVFGFWGLLEEAEEMIINSPFEAEVSVWRSLLDSCRLHSNTSIGKSVAKRILAIEPQDASTYTLMSNLYSASGRWHCSDMVRDEMRERGFRKHPCRSWIIHQKEVHSFYVRDKAHPEAKDIYSGLDVLILECMKDGYEADTSFVLHELEEYQKKDFLFYHSAKLAATYGLLVTKPGKPIRVVKNINLCGDCHTFLKHVSAVTGREILLRDASGFHCFSNGGCSCKDYW